MTEILLIIPVILLSLSIHEFSHGKAADMLGDPTPRSMGRLTLNPIAHLDPIGALVLLLTRRFGWAKPVPINPRNFRNPQRDILLVSLAGPLSNIGLAILISFIFRFVLFLLKRGAINYAVGNFAFFLVEMIQIGIIINLALAIFNLLPVPPLDGSKILRGVLPYRYHQYLNFLEGPYGFMIIILLLFTGVIGRVISPVIFFFYNVLMFGA